MRKTLRQDTTTPINATFHGSTSSAASRRRSSRETLRSLAGKRSMNRETQKKYDAKTKTRVSGSA
jgi:hypothetical protein